MQAYSFYNSWNFLYYFIFVSGFHNRNEANFLRKEVEIEKDKKMIFSEEDIGDTDSFGDGSDEENVYDLNDSFIDDSNAFDLSDSFSDDDAAKPLVQPEHPKVGGRKFLLLFMSFFYFSFLYLSNEFIHYT